MIKKKCFRFGFTLAEVLIVISIIGIIAALTTPIIIKNKERKVALTGVKVAYAKINDGFLFMRSDENLDDLRNSEIFHNITGENFETPEVQEQLDEQMKRYFRILKSYKAGESCEECPIYVTMDGNVADGGRYDYAWRGFSNDGMIYFMHRRGPLNGNGQGKIQSIVAYFFVDINGAKLPNKWGKDMFQYALAQNGLLYSAWGREFKESMPDTDGVNYWGDNAAGCGVASSPNVSNSLGYGCTARIIEQGWQIDYD